MPGFMQFITGVYLFAGLTLFCTFKTAALYMAALAFASYGVHWFAIGWNRLRGTDPRVNVGMTITFLLLSILGVIVFFKVGDAPVGGVVIGLVCVYAADFFASLKHDLPKLGGMAERALGFFRLGTESSAAAIEYLAIAEPANRRLDAEVQSYADNEHRDLAAAEAALQAEAVTERWFDQRLVKIPLPPSAAAPARALAQANVRRAELAVRQAGSPSLAALQSFTRRHQSADAAVEAQVRAIRRALGLPPPTTS
jgi:hypothetical protein